VKRPRFSLRVLFVAVAILSLPLGWTAYQLKWIRERHSFFLKEQPDGAPMGQIPQPPNAPQPPIAPWSLRLFGEHGVKELWVFREDKERARRLFPEAKVSVWKEWQPPAFGNPSRDYSLIGPGN
jgi:hypothetical protein